MRRRRSKNAFNEQTDRARALTSMQVVLGAERSGGALFKLAYLLNIIANENERGTPSSKPQRLDGKSTLLLRSEMTSAFQNDLSVETESAAFQNDPFRRDRIGRREADRIDRRRASLLAQHFDAQPHRGGLDVRRRGRRCRRILSHREPGRQAPGGPQVGSSVELCGPRLASWCGRRRANGWSGRRCVVRALCSPRVRASEVVR